MPAWLLVLLMILTTHRGTRLVVQDDLPLVKIPRDRIASYFGRFDAAGNLIEGRQLGKVGWSIAYVLGCPWCSSVWVGGLVVWATTWFASVPVPVLVWLAASSVTGLIANHESEHEQRYELNDQAVTRGRAEAARR
jgi:Protein of unknown function (DUF1360)